MLILVTEVSWLIWLVKRPFRQQSRQTQFFVTHAAIKTEYSADRRKTSLTDRHPYSIGTLRIAVGLLIFQLLEYVIFGSIVAFSPFELLTYLEYSLSEIARLNETSLIFAAQYMVLGYCWFRGIKAFRRRGDGLALTN